MSARVLIVDDERAITSLISAILAPEGYELRQVQNRETAEQVFRQQECDVIFCDIRLNDQLGGLDLLRSATAHNPTVKVIMMTGYPDVASATSSGRIRTAGRVSTCIVATAPVSTPPGAYFLISGILLQIS